MSWSSEDIQVLRKMVAKGFTSKEIGDALGRKPEAIRQYIHKNANHLQLELPPLRGRGDRCVKQFDREWYGAVPYLHWAMTKPWRLTKLTKENMNG